LFLRQRVAFKFHHDEASAFIYDNGTIKIGRFSDFRAIEKETLRDEFEGMDAIYYPEGQFHRPPARFEVYDRSNPIYLPPGVKNVGISGGLVGSFSPDLYVYCFSYQNDLSVLASFDDDKPYDCVARCEDIFAVADLICEFHPVLKGSKYLCLPVVYRERARHPEDDYSPPLEQAFEKPIRFSANVEGRIVFIPNLPSNKRPPLESWHHPKLLHLFRPGLMPTRATLPETGEGMSLLKDQAP